MAAVLFLVIGSYHNIPIFRANFRPIFRANFGSFFASLALTLIAQEKCSGLGDKFEKPYIKKLKTPY
jgi:hypothetical protein